ncbi:hypothetical protein HOY80DRAFT_235786 [Tuber brumale]|nr:hypothetical protein HOY80DRAFT_235786 [Tuber brumale]
MRSFWSHNSDVKRCHWPGPTFYLWVCEGSSAKLEGEPELAEERERVPTGSTIALQYHSRDYQNLSPSQLHPGIPYSSSDSPPSSSPHSSFSWSPYIHTYIGYTHHASTLEPFHFGTLFPRPTHLPTSRVSAVQPPNSAPVIFHCTYPPILSLSFPSPHSHLLSRDSHQLTYHATTHLTTPSATIVSSSPPPLRRYFQASVKRLGCTRFPLHQ